MRLLPFQPPMSVLPDKSAEFVINHDFGVPSRLRYLRIYEARADIEVAPSAPVIDRDGWDVVRDALIDERYDRAQEIVVGIAGPWRPSTIIVHVFTGRNNRVLAHDTIARALWNLDLNHDVSTSCTCRLVLRNDADYERFIRAYLLVADDILDDDLKPTP